MDNLVFGHQQKEGEPAVLRLCLRLIFESFSITNTKDAYGRQVFVTPEFAETVTATPLSFLKLFLPDKKSLRYHDRKPHANFKGAGKAGTVAELAVPNPRYIVELATYFFLAVGLLSMALS
jgi:hypothetical protein